MNKCLVPLLFLTTSSAFAIDITTPLTNATPKLSVTWDRAQGASPKKCGRVYLPHGIEATSPSCTATLNCVYKNVTFTITNTGGTATAIETDFATVLAATPWLTSNQNTCTNRTLAANQSCKISASIKPPCIPGDRVMGFNINGAGANTLYITIETYSA